MANEERSVLSNTKKRRLELDFDKCLERSTDEPPPEILVVKTGAFVGDDRPTMGQREQPPSAESTEDLRRIPDNDLEEKIRRMTVSLQEGICAKLPDKGKKFKASLKRYHEERRRRELRSGSMKASNECVGIDNTERSRPGGASAEVRLEASLSQPWIRSQFASLFIRKLESGNVSCSHVADNEPVDICDDASDEDLNNPVHDDKRKRKKQQDRSTHKGKEKEGRPLKETGKSQSASAEMPSPHQSDLAGNGENHEQEHACEGLNSDKTNSGEAVVLLDEEPGTGGTASTAGARDTTIYFPSREDPECVEIQYRDLECLAPGEYLTSPIMNFYIRFLQGPLFANDNAPNDYHFFNTYFYKKLQEAVLQQKTDEKAYFVKFRRWWRGINIFQKAYIFLPVHERLHWSLAIVSIPDEADESGPIILHLDSLGYHSSQSIFGNIKRFLREEWKYLNEENAPLDVPIPNKIWKDLPRRIDERVITVPQQSNDSDCGLFVLYFMERFIEGAPQRLRKKNLRMFGKSWFKPEEASALRGKIRNMLLDEFDKLEA